MLPNLVDVISDPFSVAPRQPPVLHVENRHRLNVIKPEALLKRAGGCVWILRFKQEIEHHMRFSQGENDCFKNPKPFGRTAKFFGHEQIIPVVGGERMFGIRPLRETGGL